MNEEKILSFLGLCRRAGRIAIGTEAVCESLRNGKTKLVLYSKGASAETVKKITDKCRFYRTECRALDADPGVLGHAVGKMSGICALGVEDEGFCLPILKQTDTEEHRS